VGGELRGRGPDDGANELDSGRSQRGLVQLATLAVLLLASSALSACGSGSPSGAKHSTATTPHKPTRYAEVLPAGMSAQQVSAPLCAKYRSIIVHWKQDTAIRLKTLLATVTEQYNQDAAYAFMNKPGTGWLHADNLRLFSNAVSGAADVRLYKMAGTKRRFITKPMYARFEADTLRACHASGLFAATRRSLTQLDASAGKVVRAANAKAKADAAKARAQRIAAANAWHAGYIGPIPTDNGSGYTKWRTDLGCASYAVNGCWRIEIVTSAGCSSMYVQINEMSGGTIVGNAIASQENVPPRVPVLLELDADQSSSVTASAPTITCYP